jgi:beta-mannosidase
LRFEGLATRAEVWLNGALLLTSQNMFVAHAVEVALSGHDELCLCFRALTAWLARPTKRARWRPAMIDPTTLRSVRTTMLGHMPGWCPPVHVVGPWRPITVVESAALRIQHCQLRAELLDESNGILHATLVVSGLPQDCAVTLNCADTSTTMHRETPDTLRAELPLKSIQPWWPHTHGQPQRYAVQLKIGETSVDLGKVGFRRIEVDRGADGSGFALKINDQRIFCRGACWTSADLVGMAGTRDAYWPWLKLMQAANMNMVRVGGTMVYESDAFYDLCDELGLMVWQDFMFANFDYPVSDASFEAGVRQEVAQFLDRTQTSCSITVLCGGSEVAQQAAMLGLSREHWSNVLSDRWLPELCSQFRPDVPYVPNSPSGGALPFIANAGVTHYYGVGAYMRPLDDARRAEVKFATECLAFANVPEESTLQQALPVAAVHHPQWKQRVPRDRGASWDFEDVRDHYLKLLYDVDPSTLRRTDVERYLNLSRAVTGEVMEAVFAEWRRKRSPTAGGLVWTFQDLWPGAGWGVVDALGEPKAAWYALRRAFRSLQVAMTDEGVNGLAIHVLNDYGVDKQVRLKLACWRDALSVVDVEREFLLPARGSMEISSAELLDRFYDISYAYRFGPVGHDVTVVTLSDAATGQQLAEAFHFPCGRQAQPRDIDWRVRVEQVFEQWYLHVQANASAVSVHIVDDHYRAEDNWFHLPPNAERCLQLLPRSVNAPPPNGSVSALNSLHAARYGSHA